MPRPGGMRLNDESGRSYDAMMVSKTDGQPLFYDDDYDVITKLTTMADYGLMQWQEFNYRHQRCIRFMNDDQWSDDEKAFFKALRRDPITVNLMWLPAFQAQGLQRLSRSEIRMAPGDKWNDQQITDVLSRLFNWWSYNSKLNRFDAKVFAGGLNGLESWHTYVDYSDNRLGDVKVEKADSFSVYYDPKTTDLLLSDCRWIAKIIYLRSEEIKARWPKAKRLRFDPLEASEWYKYVQGDLAQFRPSIMVNQEQDLYAVIEMEERYKKMQPCLVTRTGRKIRRIDPGQLTNEDRIMYQLQGLYIYDMPCTCLKTTHMLPYMFQPLGGKQEWFENYSYQPFMARFAETKLQWSSTYNQSNIGLQREINIGTSQFQEEVTRDLMPSGFIKGDTELTKRLNKSPLKIGEWQDVAEGAVIERQESSLKPELAKARTDMALQLLERKTAFASLSQGGNVGSDGESGLHRQQLNQERNTTLYPFMDDFDDCRANVANAMIERGVQTLTPERLQEILGDPPESGAMVQYERICNDVKQIQHFDTRVGGGAFETTQDMIEHTKKMDLLGVVMKITPEIIDPGEDVIKGSGLPDEVPMAQRFSKRYQEFMALKLNAAKPQLPPQ